MFIRRHRHSSWCKFSFWCAHEMEKLNETTNCMQSSLKMQYQHVLPFPSLFRLVSTVEDGKINKMLILKYAFMLASSNRFRTVFSFKFALIYGNDNAIELVNMHTWMKIQIDAHSSSISNAMQMIYSIRLHVQRITNAFCKDERDSISFRMKCIANIARTQINTTQICWLKDLWTLQAASICIFTHRCSDKSCWLRASGAFV